ncbi:MAG TPA: glycosyltransferase [Phycisphaerae bacterium]|nr:glycosyltransferase [Phycisphaerae bacterium]
MYVISIGVPFLPDGPKRALVKTDWAQSLRLLRDSFDGRFGTIVVAAPQYAPNDSFADQSPETLHANEDIRFVAVGRFDWRLRRYWLNDHRVRAAYDRAVQGADIVHASVNDILRPFGLRGFQAALRHAIPTVWVEDTDIILQNRQLLGSRGLRSRLQMHLRNTLLHRQTARAVAAADLTLLKGQALMQRYARFGRNVREIMNVSMRYDWIVPPDRLSARLAGGTTHRSLRCLTVGRLIARKGVDHSIRAVHHARQRGADLRLDVIGSGEQQPKLEQLTRQLDLESRVRFLGPRSYGAELIDEMATYDAFLFTPLCEDTPRSIFDAMAAALPIVAYDIPYTRQLVDANACGLLAPLLAHERLAHQLLQLASCPDTLCSMARASRGAALANTAETWYRRRAQWTVHAWHQARRR